LWIAVLGCDPRLLRGKLVSHLDSRGIVLRATRIQVKGIGHRIVAVRAIRRILEVALAQ
jgi:hypothetical protein